MYTISEELSVIEGNIRDDHNLCGLKWKYFHIFQMRNKTLESQKELATHGWFKYLHQRGQSSKFVS